MRRTAKHNLMLLPLVGFGCSAGTGERVVELLEPPVAVVEQIQTRDSTVNLLDPSIPPAVAGTGGWDYQVRADADLTGDGRRERIVMTARVELIRGEPAWDDGQPWQVYVEDPNGSRTYLYAQRLQLGSLTMRVTEPESGATPEVVLLEHLPQRMTVYTVKYGGPGRSAAMVRFQRDLDPGGERANSAFP